MGALYHGRGGFSRRAHPGKHITREELIHAVRMSRTFKRLALGLQRAGGRPHFGDSSAHFLFREGLQGLVLANKVPYCPVQNRSHRSSSLRMGD